MDASYQINRFGSQGSNNGSSLGIRILVRPLQYILDVMVLTTAFTLAYLLRFDFQIPPAEREYLLVQLALAVLIQFSLLNLAGVYAFIWRYVGMAELKTFVRAAVYSALPILFLRLLLPEAHQILRVPF